MAITEKRVPAFIAYLRGLCNRRPVKDKNAGRSQILQELGPWHTP
jgi:hypothetical protein